MWHRRDIGLWFFGIAESFPGFSMAIIFDCLHILGILFSMKHVLSIVCNHLCALGPRFFNKMDCVIDHITDNRIDIVGITETWLSNNDKNNMPVIKTCLDSGYTLHHRPRNTGRRGGGVGVLINNHIKHQSRILHDKSEITSFESIEVVITLGSITI